MSPSKCRDCGKKRLVWVTASNGQNVLYELGPPHFVRCPNKDGPGDYQAAHSENALVAIEALRGLGLLMREAKELLKDIPEGEPTDMVLAALKKKGAG